MKAGVSIASFKEILFSTKDRLVIRNTMKRRNF